MTRLDGKPYTRFQLRKLRVVAGEASMLLAVGWEYIGPAKHTATALARYWINPRSKMKYTQRAAVDIEELRESMNTQESRKKRMTGIAPENFKGKHKRGGRTGARINFSEPKNRNRRGGGDTYI